mmetsp:Transcript_2233/g.8067  ORF Transcript_2233/g.8067 Transcript_2233/m.8067 type:complete len:265 (-) Transcript_2233:298-1092(-)
MLGLVRSSVAIAHLFLSPPETPLVPSMLLPMIVFSHFSSPSRRMAFAALCAFLELDMSYGSLMCAAKRMVSRTVIVLSKQSSWCTKAEISLMSVGEQASSPFRMIWPEVFFRFPPRMFRKVVFPAPEGPKIASSLPASWIPLMFLSTWCRPFSSTLSLPLFGAWRQPQHPASPWMANPTLSIAIWTPSLSLPPLVLYRETSPALTCLRILPEAMDRGARSPRLPLKFSSTRFPFVCPCLTLMVRKAASLSLPLTVDLALSVLEM